MIAWYSRARSSFRSATSCSRVTAAPSPACCLSAIVPSGVCRRFPPPYDRKGVGSGHHTEEAMSGAHDPYGALRLADYRRLLAGSVLGGVGAEVQAVAVGWELYERTGPPAALGLTGLAQFLPVLLLALPAGQAADRYSRKGLLQLAQGGMALASVG